MLGHDDATAVFQAGHTPGVKLNTLTGKEVAQINT